MSITSKQNFILEFKNLNLLKNLSYEQYNTIIDDVSKLLDSYDIELIPNNNIIEENYKMYLKCFLESKEIEGRSKKTLERYNYILTRFFKEINIPINKITIFNLRNYLLNEKSRGISDKTLNGIRDVFNSFFGWLWKEGLIENNPCNNLGPIKCIKKIRKPYSDSDIEKLKEKCYDVRDKAFICFMLSTGCRISEICQLNKSDINFITLECKVLGKGDKERIVFIDDVTSMLLQRYLSERKDEYDALFIGKGTCRMTLGGVRARLKTIAIEAGVENVHPHRFRRTLATNLISHGMAIQDVSMILGHEKIDTTMTYVYRDKESVKNSYKKFSY